MAAETSQSEVLIVLYSRLLHVMQMLQEKYIFITNILQ